MLTPLEIENKKFSKQMMNGYNVEEIDDFLDRITEDYAKLYKEVAELKDKMAEMEQSVSHYKTIENTLQSTLVMAQSTAEEIKRVATQEAEQIVRDAELNAKESIASMKAERIAENKKIEDMKKQFSVYKAKMEALLISQLELLKEDEHGSYKPSNFENTTFSANSTEEKSSSFSENKDGSEFGNDINNFSNDTNGSVSSFNAFSSSSFNENLFKNDTFNADAFNIDEKNSTNK